MVLLLYISFVKFLVVMAISYSSAEGLKKYFEIALTSFFVFVLILELPCFGDVLPVCSSEEVK